MGKNDVSKPFPDWKRESRLKGPEKARHRALIFSDYRCYCCNGRADDVFGYLPKEKWASNNVYPLCFSCMSEVETLTSRTTIPPREVCDKVKILNRVSLPVRDQLMHLLLTTNGIQDKV